jgi:hypothetical protein
MTFDSVVSTILNFAGQSSGGDFESFVKVLVNEVYREILDAVEMPGEHREFTLASVASTSQYGMPLYVKEVLNIEDPTTPRFVYEVSRRFFDKNYPGTTESGTPSMAYPLGNRGVQKFPAANGTLTVESASTADTGTNYRVRVTGFDTNGVLVTERVTMSGTTPVATTNSYSATLGIERLVKEPASGYAFAGNVKVKDASGNVLATIPTWWNSPEYAWVEFHPIPGAAITYTIRCAMRQPPLVNDGDWPNLPDGYHIMLVYGVTKDLLPGLGKSAVGDRHRETFETLLRQLKRMANYSPGGIHVFADVQSGAALQNRPMRPLIQGVDFGLATGV